VDLRRTNLIMEFGPYGPSGAGGNSSVTGFAAPVGARNFTTWPFMPNTEIMRQKDAEANRRRDRLRQLALGWYYLNAGGSAGQSGGGSAGAPTGGDSNGAAAGAGPGKIF
jgi:hypothetical protein